jgi:hypothetical protein
MFDATAQKYAYVRFRQPVGEYCFEIPAAYAQAQAFARPLASDEKLGSITGPVAIPAKWIGTIERRIQQSVPDPTILNVNDEGWLDSDIATYALCFFDTTSDVLPTSEPYLYTTLNGDLVAEFAGRHGKLTNVISKGAVNSFAIVNGQMMKTTINFPLDNVAKARQELMQITEQL